MHVDEMNRRIEAEGPYVWCDPWDVEGVDFAAVKSWNERRWFSPVNVKIEEEEETPDEVIVEYLCSVITRILNLRLYRKQTEPDLDIDGVKLVKSIVFLVCEMGSSYAATIMGMQRRLVKPADAKECFALVKDAYDSSTWFVRDILRDFIIDLFEFGPLWEDEPYGGRFSELWTEEELTFLHQVFENGYLTIDKEDASLFVDGTKRW